MIIPSHVFKTKTKQRRVIVMRKKLVNEDDTGMRFMRTMLSPELWRASSTAGALLNRAR